MKYLGCLLDLAADYSKLELEKSLPNVTAVDKLRGDS
jgi:hypothetical protein